MEVDRQVRVLEKLREKREREHQQAEFKRETQRLDEAASIRAATRERQRWV